MKKEKSKLFRVSKWMKKYDWMESETPPFNNIRQSMSDWFSSKYKYVEIRKEERTDTHGMPFVVYAFFVGD